MHANRTALLASPPKKQKNIETTFDPFLPLEVRNDPSANPDTFPLSMSYATAPCRSFRPLLYRWDTSKPTSFNAVLVKYSSPSPPHYVENIISRYSNNMIMDSIEDDEEDDVEVTEATKLKGVLWPGMDIFDAATPLMRKKRNQKKHTSVLERLEQNSLIVEPMERIYSPMGTLKKERKITGRVDFDTSPVMMYEEALPPPPKRRVSTKGPLAEKDVNAPKVKRRRQISTKNTKKAQMNDEDSGVTPVIQKRTFTVFRDDGSAQFGNPSGMRYLTAEYQPAASFSNTTRPRTSPVKNERQANAIPPSFFAEAYDGYQAVRTAPQYAIYNYGYDIPGFFSYPPQQQRERVPANLLALQQADDDRDAPVVKSDT